MDPVLSAAEMIADDAIRLAKKQGATSPEQVMIDLGRRTAETSEGLTVELVRQQVHERWAEVGADD